MSYVSIKKYLKDKILGFITPAVNELLAGQLLTPLLTNAPYTPITSWSVSPSLIAHIANDIIINQRKTILEFGSGASTLLIARVIHQKQLPTKLISVESDVEWVKLQKQNLESDGTLQYVNFIHAPITLSPYTFKSHKYWFCSEILKKHLPKTRIDAVLVDGPKGETPYARYGALPFVSQYLSDNYIIFLDDTDRLEEREILQQWTRLLPQGIMSYQSNYGVLKSKIGYESSPICFKHP